MTIKELKKGDFFTKKAVLYPSENQVFVRGEYDRSTRRYECYRYSDVNDTQYLRGDKIVFCDLIF